MIINTARPTVSRETATATNGHYALRVEGLNVFYGMFQAVRGVDLDIHPRKITALIGPSGCGKSTVLRCFNRMNDLIPTARIEGAVEFHGKNLYAPDVDAVEVRRRIGMVFQKPNPFPKSIYDNVAWGARINGYRGNMDELVEESLRSAALWDEVKDKLKQNGYSLSGGQQQRLCIARAIATKPDIILMDEPCSALDPIATLKIEDLMRDLAEKYTIIIVTHNMQQAARVRLYRVLQHGGRSGGVPGRIREDADDFHQPERQADRGLHQRTLRMMPVGKAEQREQADRRCKRMTRKLFEQSLVELQENILALGDIVVEALGHSVDLLQQRDLEGSRADRKRQDCR